MDLTFSYQKDKPVDKNGNKWGYIKQHGILSQYDPIGIDNRGMSIFEDRFGQRQQAILDDKGNFEHGTIREGGWYHSDNPYEHIVNTAEDFGRWHWVEPEYVEEIQVRNLDNIDPELDNSITPTTEAIERWEMRGDPDLEVLDAWEESYDIEWPRNGDPADARYHPETGCTFLKDGDALITVYPKPSNMDEKWLAEEILSQI